MGLINKIKEWCNAPSWEEHITQQFNEAINDYKEEVMNLARIRQDKLNSYESMTERQLLIEIAKNTLKEIK